MIRESSRTQPTGALFAGIPRANKKSFFEDKYCFGQLTRSWRTRKILCFFSGWWFRICFIFILIWGNDPIWLIYVSDGLKPATIFCQCFFLLGKRAKIDSYARLWNWNEWIMNGFDSIFILICVAKSEVPFVWSDRMDWNNNSVLHGFFRNNSFWWMMFWVSTGFRTSCTKSFHR